LVIIILVIIFLNYCKAAGIIEDFLKCKLLQQCYSVSKVLLLLLLLIIIIIIVITVFAER